MHGGLTGTDAGGVLATITGQKRHEFWADDIGYEAVKLGVVQGHRQVTDAYLAQLARQHGAQLATLDSGLAAAHGDVAELLEGR
jgi:predicted nucleic acid-binding protein